ncbi:putative mannosylphosphorylation protein [Botrytis fragariae]|uniref:Putative mannosylphosphorylation protein n=1 Tax=Botrytis fragariae TaxID=1964551 RepID=A0A8H6EH68_9HELO|nr:putative mannosylphosphorylation protein [Botrytis fragariae]KAF5871770.1 putative mannosylphosphorylation protein [Botrytis fragariae]
MRFSWIITLPGLLSVVSALAIQKRDADFYSVRTKLHKDMSGRRGDPSGKYFHESVFHPHYDGRFADKQLGYRERRQALSNLIQTYLATFSDIGVETWLMHGTLLGWWWNRKILPWDSDSDVQVSEASMHFLASYYNMTVFHYKTPRIPEGRDYMLEINPHYINREQSDKLNVIDARWVDTTSGLFIDITTARYNYTHPAGEGMMSCKDGHEYRDTYIFPLRDTFFEGAPAKIPFAYKEILEAEYHEKSLTLTEFEGHHFDDDKMEWIPVKQDIQVPMEPQKAAQPPPKTDAQKAEEAKQAAENAKKLEEAKKLAEAQKATEEAKEKAKQKAAQEAQQDDTPPVSKQPIKEEQPKSQSHDASEPPPAQRAVEKKIFTAAEKKANKVQKAEDKRKQDEQKAADARQKNEENMKGEVKKTEGSAPVS